MNECEVWRDIDGFEGYYQVSNLGNVRAIGRWIKNGHNKQRWQEGAPMRQVKNCFGYPLIGLMKNRNKKTVAVHRLVAKYFVPNPDLLSEVNHKDGIKTNNHSNNLEWTSRSKNVQHAYDNGLKKAIGKKGIENHNAKLNRSKVNEIKSLFAEKQSIVNIAALYNVSRAAIHHIIKGKSWV